ncbi:hypothetical protein GCM10025777_22160 [Membranihabitans marinus]
MIGKVNGFGQIETLQLNLLLEKDQEFSWVKDYSLFFHGQIPGQIILGQLTSSNEVIGLMHVDKIEENLLLRGIIHHDTLTLIEWYNDDESGRLELKISDQGIHGYWYNMDRTIQIPLNHEKASWTSNSVFRQYYSDEEYFATQITPENEILLENKYINEDDWNNREMVNSCALITREEKMSKYCSSALLSTYPLVELDLQRIMWGEIPLIPHDEEFNSTITKQLSQWKDKIFVKNDEIFSDNRWSDHHLVWFTPDYISDEIVSGMLSIQYYGSESLHSYTFIYDKKNKKFLDQSSFFRSNTPWVETFQIRARQIFEQEQSDLYKLFPKAAGQLKYHLSLTPIGLMISTDYNTYFGRMVYHLKKQDVDVYMQRFAPYREKLYID